MKCNLLPSGYRQQHGLWQRPACLSLALALALCLGAAFFFQYRLHWEKAYYTDCLYPLQQQIQQGNEVIRRRQAQAEGEAKARQEGPLLTPSLMVALAGSKPAGLVVEKISSRSGRVVIEGRTASPDTPQQWQRALQQQGLGQAAVARMKPDMGEGIPFALEVTRREGLAKRG
ncbi:MAG: hypothetical protein MSS75_02585 [Megasphaera sp.]|uniref:hypothetical protein n=1 Tax=Megasphaera sp. TaxID=2023260 RepID=UPI0025B7EF33|nr:hypothetical protein [Megasphaera sp.]MCF0152226.1 hypothetical protein [Megasphaera sp.]MCI7599928.1 hypothetical protein [Megasphaera sp.]